EGSHLRGPRDAVRGGTPPVPKRGRDPTRPKEGDFDPGPRATWPGYRPDRDRAPSRRVPLLGLGAGTRSASLVQGDHRRATADADAPGKISYSTVCSGEGRRSQWAGERNENHPETPHSAIAGSQRLRPLEKGRIRPPRVDASPVHGPLSRSYPRSRARP